MIILHIPGKHHWPQQGKETQLEKQEKGKLGIKTIPWTGMEIDHFLSEIIS